MNRNDLIDLMGQLQTPQELKALLSLALLLPFLLPPLLLLLLLLPLVALVLPGSSECIFISCDSRGNISAFL